MKTIILQRKPSLSSSPSNNRHTMTARIIQALQLQRTQKVVVFAFCALLAFHVTFRIQPKTIQSTASPATANYRPAWTTSATTITPQSVFLWPFDPIKPHNTEIVQLAYNGIRESPYLQLTDDRISDPHIIWIGDAGDGYWYGWYPWVRNHVLQFMLRMGVLGKQDWGYDRSPWCARFLQEIRMAQRERKRRGLSTQWPIYILDLTDFSHMLRCPTIEQEMEAVYYGKRSIVQGRTFSKDQQWTTFGQKVNLPSSYLHTPLIVRTDTIQALQDVLFDQYNQTLASPIEQLPRNIDVAHFWAAPSRQSLKGIKGSRSRLRNLVSAVITELGNEHPEINAFVGFAGTHGTKGRYDVAGAYIDALLQAKIAVVSQCDRWEDHYRLYEALATGGMVITDRMLSLPRGLVNGTSIVECTSGDDLKAKILYYLSHPEERMEIARQGRLAAMSQHRSWHRMEEFVFGQIRSNCSRVDDVKIDNNDCPFVVHAS